jgi:CspA family cold shock protein
MLDGTVKWYDKKKGYGFISQQAGGDVFIHHTCLDRADVALNEGDEVSFELASGEKGPKANNLTLKV